MFFCIPQCNKITLFRKTTIFSVFFLIFYRHLIFHCVLPFFVIRKYGKIATNAKNGVKFYLRWRVKIDAKLLNFKWFQLFKFVRFFFSGREIIRKILIAAKCPSTLSQNRSKFGYVETPHTSNSKSVKPDDIECRDRSTSKTGN